MSITWVFLKKYHLNPPTIMLLRKIDVQKKYINFKKIIKENNNNIKNYILTNFFKNNENIIFIKNNFPYDVELNIYHYILWFNSNSIHLDEIDKLDKLDKNNYEKNILKYIKYFFDNKKINDTTINNYIFSNYEFIFFENIKENKSINSIKHIHVFFKLK
tara:strand:+ start:109 stop:588 length:480 start_codon:yes stop_codon:yes gene_type:complete